MKTGIEIIAEERKRQIEVEEWTPEEDDLYTAGQLALAGATYAIPTFCRDDYGGYVYSTDDLSCSHFLPNGGSLRLMIG